MQSLPPLFVQDLTIDCAVTQQIRPCKPSAAGAIPATNPLGIYRSYSVNEAVDEILMRRIAGYMLGFMTQQKPRGVD